MACTEMRSLVVAGSPEPSSDALLRRLSQRANFILAVDRGIDYCMGAGVRPTMFVGDCDTASEEAVSWARHTCGSERLFPPEKDDTDLGLALQSLRNRAQVLNQRLSVTICCASGGRPEHALGVFGVLSANADLAPVLEEDQFQCRILSPAGEATWEFDEADKGKTFSAIPVAAHTVVSEKGMKWEIDKLELPLLSDRGVSNEIVAPCARITCHSGVVAAFLTRNS